MKAKAGWLLAGLLVAEGSFAGTYPIDGLPVYNGTYYGTPGADALYSKTVPRYTTLYRDNYDRKSGCAGEGCGKHPGVDIRVPSGTPVRAAFGGKVARVETCDLSWGGLVVVETDNPYLPGSKIYHSYAHMRQVLASKDQTVKEGQEIGKSGGDPAGDPCYGASRGAHLHFQIDRPHTETYPWYPSKDSQGSSRVEIRDADFEVTSKTYNPLPFVRAGWQTWRFNEDGYYELWQVNGATSKAVLGGYLRIDSSSNLVRLGRSGIGSTCAGSDGYPCSRNVTIEADIYKHLGLVMDFKCTANPVEIFFHSNLTGWNSTNAWQGLSFNYNGPRTYLFDLTGHPGWTGVITDIVVFPSIGCTAQPGPYEFLIDQIFVQR